jgi:ATP-binding cassette subfamily A (ABC1) protein 3
MYEAILKQATGNPNFKFKVTNAPFPVTQRLKDRAATASGILIVFIIAIGFSLIPASVVANVLHEKEHNLKHIQIISGMNLPAYWVSNFLFDIFKAYIPCLITIGLIEAFDLKY